MEQSQKILSDITVFGKYAKYVPELQRRETWDEICDRNAEMHVEKYPSLAKEIRDVYERFVKTRKVLPSMRSMQFGGTPIELSNNRMFNCAYMAANAQEVFSEAMFLLLGGSGVGFSVQKHHVEQLPVVQGHSDRRRRFLIGDSIEGWADAIKVLMRSYFEGRPKPAFDFRDIRPKGAALITSGGKAPGPDPLKLCIEQIKVVMNGAVGRRMTTVEVHDVMCHIADAVLSGGIRRAALISLFSHDDMDMLSCKTGSWWELNPQRGRANNSVVLERGEITEEQFKDIWKRVELSGCGEPGFFWTNDVDLGTNPCISGDALITVKDHGINGGEGVPYQIPMEMLVKMFEDNALMPFVKSFNVETGEAEWKEITAAAMTRADAEVVKVCADGMELVCTPDHKIYTVNRGYVEAQDLTAEDEIVMSWHSKIAAVVEKVEETEDVYDITVKDNHNFFADGILVHNCCEISLKDAQFCNLTEINVSDVEDQDDLNERVKAGAFIGTLQAGYTDFHYLRDKWKENTEGDALLGVGMTGIASGRVLKLDLEEAARVATEANKTFAEKIGINEAARVTTVKPSGCFAPDTEIRTDRGVMTIADVFELCGVSLDASEGFHDIDAELKVFDESNTLQPVIKLYVNGTEKVLKIEFSDGAEVTCTPNHKFMTTSGEWKRADELGEGAAIKHFGEADVSVVNVVVVERVPTYDIEVASTHTYQLANGVVTHNTSSLTVGSSSGIHAWHAPYYIRRMRVGKNEPLYFYMKEKFPDLIEDCQFKPHIEAVMSFPQRAPEGAIYRDETAHDLLERVKRFNMEWVAGGYREGANQHNVSCTISVREDEWESVGNWMWENRDSYTGISVLPHDGGTYPQAPFEDCTKEEYERMEKLMTNIDLRDVVEVEDSTNLNDQQACAGGACEI